VKKPLIMVGIFIALLVSVASAAITFADGTEELGMPGIPIASGSGFVSEGVGLFGGIGILTPGTINVSVPAGASVEQVILYWAGVSNTDPDLTTSIVVDGNTVTGDSIGGPTFLPGPNTQLITYRADITSLGLVSAGANSLDISGPSFVDRSNNGAGVIVIYDDGSGASTIDIRDGSDFALSGMTAPLNAVVPQTFTFPASSEDRTAELALFVGDVQDNPNVIRTTLLGVEIDGDTTIIDTSSIIQSTDGAQWDAVTLLIDIPAGATSATIELISGGSNPASFVWIAGALEVPPPAVPENPAIDIEKATNGEDADNPTGPVIEVGGTATFTYVVTNTGDVPLANVVVVDDNGTPGDTSDDFSPAFTGGDTNNDGLLDLTETWTYEASRVVTAGQYTNVSEVCGDSPEGQEVCDEDPSNHFGEEEPPTGGEGCTPGYWKQSHHFDSWVDFDPDDSYSDVFGVSPSFGDKTLLQVLKQGGGGEKALGRHAVAALLNTANGGVSYAFTTAGVIDLVQQAYATNDFNGIKDQLEAENEQGCPLN
jgi:hypothetical protein